MTVHHRFAEVDGHRLFYREAGPADAPALLLLHGFPTSSVDYEPVIDRLAKVTGDVVANKDFKNKLQDAGFEPVNRGVKRLMRIPDFVAVAISVFGSGVLQVPAIDPVTEK